MLENCSQLDYLEIYQGLIGAAVTDSFTTMTVPNYSYGYGKNSAADAVMHNLFEPVLSPAGKVLVCEGDSVSVSGPGGMSSYKWSTGDTINPLFVDSSGLLSLIAIDSNGCTGYTDTLNIESVPNPTRPTITKISGNELMSSAANSYQWYLNGLMLSGETAQNLIAMNDGSYNVEIRDTNLCGAISDTISIVLAVNENYLSTQLIFTPNPSQDGQFTLLCEPCGNDLKFHLEISDLQGKQILSTNLFSNDTFSLSEHKSGFYFYRLRNENGTFSTGKLALN